MPFMPQPHQWHSASHLASRHVMVLQGIVPAMTDAGKQMCQSLDMNDQKFSQILCQSLHFPIHENEDPEEDENIDHKYNWIDEDELKDPIEVKREQANPNQHWEDEGQRKDVANKEEEEPDYNRTAVRSGQETD
jgi:hypothetical protein